ncbi:UDP-N-acetylglucosamine transporter TMEM241 homolog [Eucyclogobius newberryi]|uniref:UDP-N-acetylglucosamine transporter TMEM241 homolog n=1 Tax=Eucyclogobius newberryi TaxID=166745 RepID=UPI003B592F29
MQWKRHGTGFVFSVVFVASYFTNKFVLSVLKFTYPTLFQGWQTLIGAVLLLACVKLGWLEMSHINRSAALSWLPGSLLFVGNIYAGSRALSHMDIPLFFTLQNSSHVVSYVIGKVIHRQSVRWLKFISVCLMFLSAINLPMNDPGFDLTAYQWAAAHLVCVGSYRVFQVNHRASSLSDIEQQCMNYVCSVLLLAAAAHPTGDLMGALEFPSLQSHSFLCGCCISALMGFLLLLVSVKIKSGLSTEHLKVWMFVAKVTAMSLSPFIFYTDINALSLACVITSHCGEALLLYSERDSK